MARKHRFVIVVTLGAAVVAGFFALGRSAQLGAASTTASTAQVSARTRSLDRLEAQLRRQLAALPEAAPGGEPFATRSGPPEVRYVRSPVSSRLPSGDDDEQSAEGREGTLGQADGDD